MEPFNILLDVLFKTDGIYLMRCMPSPEEVLLQLAEGLKYIHSKALVHGALKPRNVLIRHMCWSGDAQSEKAHQVEIKWANASSRPTGKDESNSKIVNQQGNFDDDCWLSPEQMKNPGERVKESDDIFSEGLVFGYFLSNGRHIFGPNHEIPKNILIGEYDIERKCQ